MNTPRALRVSMTVMIGLALLSGGLAFAAKGGKKPPPEPEPEPDPPVTYTVNWLGVLPGLANSMAQDINNDGVVVGYCYTEENEDARAFVSYLDGTGQPITEDLNGLVEISEFPEDYVLAKAWAINESGQIVGWAWLPGDVDFPSLTENIGASIGGIDWARDINDHGDIVGNWAVTPDDTSYFSYLYSDEDLDEDGISPDVIALGGIAGGDNYGVHDINNAREVVGWFHKTAGYDAAFYYTLDSGMTEISFGELGQAFDANEVDESGNVVGMALREYEVQVNKKKSYTATEWYAYKYNIRTDTLVNLAQATGAEISEAYTINTFGDYVACGGSYDNSSLHLADLDETWTLDSLTGIELRAHPEEFSMNDYREICGYSVVLTGGYQASAYARPAVISASL